MDQRQWTNRIYSNVFLAEHVLRPQPWSNLRPEKALSVRKRHSKWLLGAITGHPPTAWRTGEFDPLLPFEVRPMNRR